MVNLSSTLGIGMVGKSFLNASLNCSHIFSLCAPSYACSCARLRFATNAYLDGAPHGQCRKINRGVGEQLPLESSSRLQAG